MGDIDVDSLPPVQYLIMETLAARARLGEQMWTFPRRLRPALSALQERGLIWWRAAPTYGHVQAYLTGAGRRAVFHDGYEAPITKYEHLLGDIWLYIDWRWVTRQLTTPQKELFADAVDAWSARLNDEDPDLKAGPADRWWRDG